MALQHLRSATANKRPLPTAMADGQLAINTNLASPGLFLKDSNGDLVKVGPVHVGTTAPNISPATGGQTGNSTGELWLDTSGANAVIKVWNGSAWVAPSFAASGTVVTTADTGTVTSTMLADGTIGNSDINASAAIAGTKVSPDFGSQVVTTTGRVLVGSAGIEAAYGGETRLLQVNGVGQEGIHLGNWGTGAGGVDIVFSKSKSGTPGTYTLCVDGDTLGEIVFTGADGASGFNSAASIKVTASGNHTSSVAGGVLSFYTTHNASGSTLEERMALRNNGQLLLGTPSVPSTQDLLYLNNRDATDLPVASNYSLMRAALYTQEAMAPYGVWGVNVVTSYTDGASPYTINDLIAYRASVNNTSGSNVTLTNTYGFAATPQVGLYATNGYGFYSQIAAGANKWNFYAQGTAANYFEGDVRTNTAFCYKATVTNTNTSVTMAASTLKGGIRTATPTANVTAQVPTGTAMNAAFDSLGTDHSIEWSSINLAAATFTVTITSNTDHSLVGNMTIQANTSARFLSRKTAANTFVTYRIA